MKSTCLEDFKEMYSWNFIVCCFLIVLAPLTILILIIIFVWAQINHISHTIKYPTMWAYGRNYHVDVKKQSIDCDIMFFFKQYSCSSSKDKNIIKENLQYVARTQEIIRLD